MNSKSKKYLIENQFFIGKRNRLKLNKKCRDCMHECKQSFRAEIISCKKYTKKEQK